MTNREALRIINILALNQYQHPDVVSALNIAAERLTIDVKTEGEPSGRRIEGTMPQNTFIRWTMEEEERLIAGYDSGRTTEELAKAHNRSRAAIEARLLKVGKIDVSQLSVQLRYTNPARQS